MDRVRLCCTSGMRPSIVTKPERPGRRQGCSSRPACGSECCGLAVLTQVARWVIYLSRSARSHEGKEHGASPTYFKPARSPAQAVEWFSSTIRERREPPQ